MERGYSEVGFVNCFFQGNRADVVTLDAGELYTAVKQFSLTAVAKEIYREGLFTSHF